MSQKVVNVNDFVNRLTGNVPIISQAVKIGGFKNPKEAREALKKKKMVITARADDILEKIPLAGETSEIKIKIVSLAKLGFNIIQDVPYSVVCEQAERAGLKPCPEETALWLRLQHVEQSEGEWFEIASKPIIDSEGKARIFAIGWQNGTRSLSAHYATPIVTWGANDRFAFMVPQIF